MLCVSLLKIQCVAVLVRTISKGYWPCGNTRNALNTFIWLSPHLNNAIIAALICSGSVGQACIISANSAGRRLFTTIFLGTHRAHFSRKIVLLFCCESVNFCPMVTFVTSFSVGCCSGFVVLLCGLCAESVKPAFGFRIPPPPVP
jgi:hypothetical protein